ncbi:hypothetical protein M0D21_08055 [Aquimarina sp. D1M17]|uniref:hypothetical protein n=1 Tax=Aquimarina acroporae TaxID=2937283 RepID=UPI0020BFEDB8|nr:hypothetical protein [Aquimarina acroporae]MCK8521517.1 hypothetical protein [Aquimarina acroporae]
MTLILFASCLSNKTELLKNTGWYDYGFYGKVKKSVEHIYDMRPDTTVIEGRKSRKIRINKLLFDLDFEVNFDEQGRTIKYRPNIGGHISFFEYNDQNQLVKLRKCSKINDKDKDCSELIEYLYDYEGNLIEESKYERSYYDNTRNKLINIYIYRLEKKYNKHNDIIEENLKLYDYETDYENNDAEKLESIEIRSKVFQNEYNNNMQLIKQKFVLKTNDSLIKGDRWIDYEYDDNDNLIKKWTHFASYDDIETYYSDGKLKIKNSNTWSGPIKCYYLENGDVDHVESPKSYHNTTIKCEYGEYDKVGNWTKRIIYIKGIPKYYTDRKIEYYE